jgi:peptidyl-prolyl cis-trans isomerase C
MTPRRIASASALVAFAGIALVGCSVGQTAAPASTLPTYTPWATVGKVTITKAQVVTRARILALVDKSVAPSDAVTKVTTKDAVEQLVEESLITQGNPQPVSAADRQAVGQDFGQELVQYYGSPTAVTAREKALKLTPAEVNRFAAADYGFELAAGKFEPTVSQAQVEAYYKANPSQFKFTQEEVDARHILVKTQTLAESILSQLEHGANFAQLAKKYSIDTSTASKGGNLGWFTYGTMVAPFSKAAFSTPVGHYVIAHSQYGWHVIQVLGKEPAGYLPPLAQVESQAQQAAQQAQDQVNVSQAATLFKKRFPVQLHSPSGK